MRVALCRGLSVQDFRFFFVKVRNVKVLHQVISVGGVEMQLHAFINLALYGAELSASCPDIITRMERFFFF